MAWPPPVLGTARTNLDPQMDTHAADHNALALGINDTVARIDSRVSVRKQTTSAGSLPDATWTRLTCGTVEFSYGEDMRGDSAGIWTDVGGFFLFIAQVYWDSGNGTGRKMLGFSNSTTANPPVDYQASRRAITNGMLQTVVIPYYSATAPIQFHMYGYQDSNETATIQWRKQTVVRLTHAF